MQQVGIFLYRCLCFSLPHNFLFPFVFVRGPSIWNLLYSRWLRADVGSREAFLFSRRERLVDDEHVRTGAIKRATLPATARKSSNSPAASATSQGT
jgi:hypothetical protein